MKQYPCDAIIDDTKHFAFVDSLLRCHPHSDEKYKNTVSCQYQRIYDENSHDAVRLIRNDGSTTDISYIKCLNKNRLQGIPVSEKEKDALFRQSRRAAMRNAVTDQIDYFRSKFFEDKTTVICDISKLEIQFDNCHVDHIVSFDSLCQIFEGENDITENMIGGSQDNQNFKYLNDDIILSKWCDFHQSHANLRVVHPVANLSILRRK